MAELENLLLEAAGRTSSSGKNRHSHSSARRRHGGSYSDGGSDSRGDDFDDGCGYASGKPSGPQVHLKKRLDPTEIDDERGSQEECVIFSRMKMIGGSLQRCLNFKELILSERAQKKDDKSLKEKFRPKWDKGKTLQSRKETPPLPSSRVRSSARSADRAAAKDDALNELRAKRLKQQDP
ncbi:hypothetical protein ACFX2H_036522 [Malus domestica]